MKTDLITAEAITIYLDSQIFTRDGILKCCYWYTASYLIDLQLSGDFFMLMIRPQINEKLVEPTLLYNKLNRDLFDFQVRDTITKETQNIRDLLIAKAFANGALDEPFIDDVSDPVSKR